VFAEFQKGLAEDNPYEMIRVLQECDADRSVRVHPYLRAWLMHSLTKVTKDTPMHVRFALVSSSFTDKDFEDCKIPTELSRVAKAVHRNFDQWINFTTLYKWEIVKLFERVRAYSNRELFDQVLDVIEVYNTVGHFNDYTPHWRQRIVDSLKASADIDAAGIADACKDPKDIRYAIFEARVDALR
jgi:hypothetical protein